MIEAHEPRALVELALETYRAEILPELPADKRYVGAMIANALDIAARSLAAAAPQDDPLADISGTAPADTSRLARLIREDRVPIDDATLRASLRAAVERELAVRNPKVLTPRRP